MKRRKRGPCQLMLEELEGRVMLSGAQGHPATMPSAPVATGGMVPPAVHADLQQIKGDQAQLQAALKSLRPKLVADQQALAAAIDRLAPTLAPLREQYQADCKAWQGRIQADQQAVSEARQQGSAAQLAAGQAKLAEDRAKQQQTLQADERQIRQAIAQDPKVQAAQAQLAEDTAAVKAAQEQLRADYAQLRIHLEGEQQAAGDSGGE
jgi:hypothetical protein